MTPIRQVTGKVALVTGANRGLGAALVEVLLERGASKIYCCARDSAQLRDRLAHYGARAEAITVDVTNTADVSAAGNRLLDVDIVVSNAGVTLMVPLLATTLDDAQRIMDTNYFGPLRLLYAFANTLKERRGGFISILSLAGLLPASGAELYSASKAAGTMLGYAIAQALPEVAVSLSHPGLMDTDMMKAAPLAKTSPRDIAEKTIDGWLAGELSIFPDLHSQFVREAIVGQPETLFADPYALMNEALMRYIAERGAPART